MSKHAWITASISLTISVLLFAFCAAVFLLLPSISTETLMVFPVLVLVGLLLAPFAAERLSPSLTPGEHPKPEEEVSSGRTCPRGG
jgi:hypothetical protein